MKIYYFDQSNTGMGHIPASTLVVDYSYNVTLSGDLLSLDSIQTPHLEFTLGQKYLFTQNDSTNAGYKLTFPYYDFSSQLWTDSTLGLTPHGVPGRNDAYVLFTGDISANLRKYCLVNSAGNRVTALDTPQITVTDISFGGSSTKAFSGLPFTVTFDNNFTSTSIYQIKNDSNTVINSGTIGYGTGANVEITIDSANPSGTYFIGWEYGTDVSFEVEQLESYKFTVQTNIFNDPVYAVYNTTDDVYYNQSELLFTASNVYLIDLSSTITDGSYDLVFGTVIDNSNAIVDSSPYVTSTSANTIFLDLRSYTGDPLYYFDRAIANMGYNEMLSDTLAQRSFNPASVLGDWITVSTEYTYSYTLSGETTYSFANGPYIIAASDFNTNNDIPKHFHNVLDIGTSGQNGYDWASGTYRYVSTFPKDYVAKTTVDGTTYQGSWIQLSLPYQLKINEVSIRGRNSYTQHTPKTVAMLGSNDNGTTFEVIDDDTILFVANATTQTQTVSITKPYSLIRMVVLRTNGGHNISIDYWNVQGDAYINLYNYIVTISGDPLVFYLDSSANPLVNFAANTVYVFDQSDSSNTGEQIVFGYTIDHSNNIFTSANGVTVVGTPGQPGAYTSFAVPSGLTGTVYYYSINTAGMGNS